jgi:hypothetical protein
MNDPSSTPGSSPAPPPPAALYAVASSAAAATEPSGNAKRKELQQEGTGPLKKMNTKMTGEQNDSGSVSESVTGTAAAASSFEDLLDDNSPSRNAKRMDLPKEGATGPRKKKKKKKPSKQPHSASTSESVTAASNFFCLLDDNCRFKILGYITWQGLAVAAQASRAFRDDCRHPSLTQNADREMTLTVRWGRDVDLCLLLAAMADTNRLATFPKLKVVRSEHVQYTLSDAQRVRNGRTIPQVTSLEMSVIPFDPFEEYPWQYPTVECEFTVRALEASVVDFLPNLRHLTLSDDFDRGGGLHHISGRCPSLDSLKWRYQSSCGFLSGQPLGRGRPVRCLDVDGCAFREEIDLSAADGGLPFVFHRDAETLERVSIRDVRYVELLGERGRAERPIPERDLVELVRRAPNLRWFRSYLTSENVAMLQRERPDVTFVW